MQARIWPFFFLFIYLFDFWCVCVCLRSLVRLFICSFVRSTMVRRRVCLCFLGILLLLSSPLRCWYFYFLFFVLSYVMCIKQIFIPNICTARVFFVPPSEMHWNSINVFFGWNALFRCIAVVSLFRLVFNWSFTFKPFRVLTANDCIFVG